MIKQGKNLFILLPLCTYYYVECSTIRLVCSWNLRALLPRCAAVSPRVITPRFQVTWLRGWGSLGVVPCSTPNTLLKVYIYIPGDTYTNVFGRQWVKRTNGLSLLPTPRTWPNDGTQKWTDTVNAVMEITIELVAINAIL